MRRAPLRAALAIALLTGTIAQARDVMVQPETVDVDAGQQIYAETCAACHGANLEGQPDWQGALPDGTRPAPPHDANGHTWHHGDGFLFVYTKFGGQAYVEMNNITGFKSAMPAFADQLDDQDIWNVLGFIKSTWPDRVQAVQRERTANQ